jgi:hypothetical protein
MGRQALCGESATARIFVTHTLKCREISFRNGRQKLKGGLLGDVWSIYEGTC